MVFRKNARCHDEMSCFCAEKSHRMDQGLNILRLSQSESPSVGKLAEKLGRRCIHLFIGALGTQDHRAKKLKAGGIFQKRFRVRP